MWGRLGPRFAIEALFLILLAVALGIADLGTPTIVAVMAAGWLLVSLIELVASREPRFSPRAERVVVEEPAPAAEPGLEQEPAAPADEDLVEPVLPRRRWFRRRQRVVATDVAPEAAVEESQPVPEAAADEVEPALATSADDIAPADETAAERDPAVERTDPPRKRRWFRRREADTDVQDDVAEVGPLPPRHVRRVERDETPAASQEGDGPSDAGAATAGGSPPEGDPLPADDAPVAVEVRDERERQTG